MQAGDAFLSALKARDSKTFASLLTENPNFAQSARAVSECGRMGWQEGLALLRKHDADLNAIYRGYRAMHSLIQEDPHAAGSSTPERVACLEWLLANGGDPDQFAAWPPARALIIAAFTGVRPYVDTILESGRARLSLFTHIALGDLAATRADLKSTPESANARDQGVLTALQCAAGSRMGQSDPTTARNLVAITALLLEQGADPNALTKSWSHAVGAADLAAGADNPEIFTLLLQGGADATRALPATLWKSNMKLAEIALSRGADPDKAVQDGRPALNELIRWGRIDAALWLLDHKASPNIPDSRGWTALHQAVSRGNERIVKALLDNGADRSLADSDGATPHDLAKVMRRSKIAVLLNPGRKAPAAKGKPRKLEPARLQPPEN